MITHRVARTLGTALVLVCACGAAHGQQGAGGDPDSPSSGMVWLLVGGGNSDNIRRVAVEPESGTFSLFGIESDLVYERSRLSLDFSADVERRNYSTAGLDDETYGQGQFSLEVHAVPDRVIWVIRDEYSHGRINPLEVSSPENRAEANEFWTGPRFDLPLGQRTILRLEALYGDRKVVDTQRLDSEADLGTLSFIRAIDATTEFALNFVSQGAEYESPPTEVNTESAYLSYRKALASGAAYLALGTTQTERGVESSETPYIDLQWTRDLGTRSHLDIHAAQQYGDFFDDPGFADGGDPLLVRDVYEEQLISIGYSIEGVRNRFSLEQSLSHSSYTSLPSLDHDDTTSSVSFSRALTSRAQLGLRYIATERDYESGERGDDRTSWNLSLDHDLGRRFSLGIAYESHDDSAVLGGEIEENIVRLDLRYALTNAAAR